MEEPIRLVRDPAIEPSVVDAPSSFEAFIEDHHARLFGALCLVTGDRYEAEEIMQDAFVRVFERWDRVSTLEDPTGYLYRTAMNVFRKRYRRASLALRQAVSLAPHDRSFASTEDREVVLRGLAQIPRDQRAALVVTALLGYSSEEAGRMLGANPSTVRARATRARAALREAIGEDR
jgi:RNA polymerase sigma-70 factor (ECF subfamily)